MMRVVIFLKLIYSISTELRPFATLRVPSVTVLSASPYHKLTYPIENVQKIKKKVGYGDGERTVR